jgi:hypothetical protein
MNHQILPINVKHFQIVVENYETVAFSLPITVVTPLYDH